MQQINIWTAFLAGIISFLSPCVLPLVPGYISFISGMSLEELSSGTDKKILFKKVGLGSIAFVLGFALVFTLLGASATAIGQFLKENNRIIAKIAGTVIVFLGLHTTGILPIKWLYYEKRFQSAGVSGKGGWVAPFLIGLAFAFGWTPCIGPILAGILAIAATQEKVSQGVILLAIYSLGLGLPFIITGFGVNYFLRLFNRFKKFIRWVEIAAGVLLIFIGILIFTNRLTMLIGYFPEWMFKFSL